MKDNQNLSNEGTEFEFERPTKRIILLIGTMIVLVVLGFAAGYLVKMNKVSQDCYNHFNEYVFNNCICGLTGMVTGEIINRSNLPTWQGEE